MAAVFWWWHHLLSMPSDPHVQHMGFECSAWDLATNLENHLLTEKYFIFPVWSVAMNSFVGPWPWNMPPILLWEDLPHWSLCPDCLWSQQHQKLIPSRSSRFCAWFCVLKIALKINLSSCSPIGIVLCASISLSLYFQQHKPKSCLCFVRWVPLKSCIKLCLFWSPRPHPSVFFFFLMTLFRIFSKLMEMSEG